MQNEKVIWTIGHSTHTMEDFIRMLCSFQIELVVDIRSFPGSRKFPWFNKDNLTVVLPEHNIEYTHLLKLGGRRKVSSLSKNIAWHHPAFRAYADYMESNEFNEGIEELMRLAAAKRVVYMCSEAVWWRCHRSLVSDYLKVYGWKVLHILSEGKVTEHPYTSAAVIQNNALHYDIPSQKK